MTELHELTELWDDAPPSKWVALAVKRLDHESFDQAVAWTYHHCMNAESRASIDAWLVDIDHPLAHEPGTPESRFRALVRDAEEKRDQWQVSTRA
jgi:hypothetical protein